MLSNDPKLRKTSAHLGAQHLLFEADYVYGAGQAMCANCETDWLIARSDREDEIPTIHDGSIASGNQMMRDGATQEGLRKELSVLCCEMEAAGLMDHFPYVVIRGCDSANTYQNTPGSLMWWRRQRRMLRSFPASSQPNSLPTRKW